ncbi:MAG TPA: hypothetical protein VLG44_02170 [Chlamydiales bacterium]|nr:hypothetical protein [Chlamydiales bacterium]
MAVASLKPLSVLKQTLPARHSLKTAPLAILLNVITFLDASSRCHLLTTDTATNTLKKHTYVQALDRRDKLFIKLGGVEGLIARVNEGHICVVPYCMIIMTEGLKVPEGTSLHEVAKRVRDRIKELEPFNARFESGVEAGIRGDVDLRHALRDHTQSVGSCKELAVLHELYFFTIQPMLEIDSQTPSFVAASARDQEMEEVPDSSTEKVSDTFTPDPSVVFSSGDLFLDYGRIDKDNAFNDKVVKINLMIERNHLKAAKVCAEQLKREYESFSAGDKERFKKYHGILLKLIQEIDQQLDAKPLMAVVKGFFSKIRGLF